MKILFIILSCFLYFTPSFLYSQEYLTNYFDGADTVENRTIEIDYRTDTINNIWQIGKPQKAIFDSASTKPNAIVTDTINFYPNNDTSSFIAKINADFTWSAGVFALQWMQKLDYDTVFDGGKLEFSVDSGLTWENALNSAYNYNFYGFNAENLDTLHNGEYVFTGTDSTWRNIWLCYGFTWIGLYNNYVEFKFTSISDGINNNKEGWLIDNLYAYTTYVHTTVDLGYENYINIFPNPTQDKLHIDLQKRKGFHLIEKMEVFDISGALIDSYENIPTRFYIDTKKYTEGNYFLKIQTNFKTETVKFVVKR